MKLLHNICFIMQKFKQPFCNESTKGFIYVTLRVQLRFTGWIANGCTQRIFYYAATCKPSCKAKLNPKG